MTKYLVLFILCVCTLRGEVFLSEDFEGAGVPSGWTTNGNANFDFGTAKEGTNSLYLRWTSGAEITATYDLGSGQERSGFWLTYAVSFAGSSGSSRTFMRFLDSSSNPVFTLSKSSTSKLTAGTGSSTTDALDLSWNFVRVYWTNNGVCSVEFNTSSSWTGSGTKYTTRTNSSVSNIRYIQFASIAINPRVDALQASTDEITSAGGVGSLTPASLLLSDVQAAVDFAVAGDTVILPAGTVAWNGTLAIRKAITLSGPADGSITITNTQGTGAGIDTDYPVITMTGSAGGRTRVSGINFHGNRTGNGIITGGTTWSELQIDNCTFTEIRGRAIYIRGLVSSLCYSNTFTDCFKAIDTECGIGDIENTSWQLPLTLGTTQSSVWEDNKVIYTAGGWYPASAGASSSQGHGGRATIRFNTFTNLNASLDIFPFVDAHGNQELVDTNSNTGAHRGTRQLEMYGNTFSSSVGSGIYIASLRGGTLLIYSNTASGTDVPSTFRFYEEDGPNDNFFLTGYPGYDKHEWWQWDNYSNESLMGTTAAPDPGGGQSSTNFVLLGTNLFLEPKADYTALPYPHPWRTESGETPPTPLPPNEVGGLQVAVSGGVVTLNWSGSVGATSYSVTRAVWPDFPSTEIGTATESTYTDSPGIGWYIYGVSAINSAGTSGAATAFVVVPPRQTSTFNRFARRR